jgi:hypothetical protein
MKRAHLHDRSPEFLEQTDGIPQDARAIYSGTSRIKEEYMKYLKMLGLAAMAALALMAIMGVGTASATEACTVNTSPCPAGSKYNSGTVFEASSTNATVTSSLGNVVCTGSGISWNEIGPGGSKLTVDVTVEWVTSSGCSLTTPFSATKHNCSVTWINLSYKGVLAKTTQPNGTFTVSSDGSGDPGFKVDCGANVLRCQFTASTLVLDSSGGNPATIYARDEPLIRTTYEGGLCPSTSTWDATYTVTKPHALYLVN